MAGNLKSRLARLREAKATGTGEAAAARVPGQAAAELPPCLSAWDSLGDFVFRRDLDFPCRLPGRLDGAPFSSLALARRGLGLGEIQTGDLRFFDLETTGLSGGTGTIAFLAALGWLSGSRLTVRQYFLSDYPGEAPFLEALLGDLPPGSILATYNGKAFDLPLLRTRCILNGIRPPDFPHLDLLFAARRLWRRPAGGASLGLLESVVLGKSREEDVPGSRIPQIWLDFVKTGKADELGAVLSHNADDVASLARLLGRAARVHERPLACLSSDAPDLMGLGRILLALGRTGEAERILEAAAEGGEEGAAILLCRRYARERRPADRARLVGALGSSALAEIERAKYLEHVERDPAAALSCVERARRAADASPRLLAAIGAREERLRQKLGSGGAAGA